MTLVHDHSAPSSVHDPLIHRERRVATMPRRSADRRTSLNERPDAGENVWTDVLSWYTRVSRVLAAELGNAGCVSLPTYEVLSGIDRAGGDVRLIDLLPVVPMSQPGLSRRVDRLCADGLVRREPDPRDGRASLLQLTGAGREALEAARPVHTRAVRAHLSGVRDQVEHRAVQCAGCGGN